MTPTRGYENINKWLHKWCALLVRSRLAAAIVCTAVVGMGLWQGSRLPTSALVRQGARSWQIIIGPLVVIILTILWRVGQKQSVNGEHLRRHQEEELQDCSQSILSVDLLLTCLLLSIGLGALFKAKTLGGSNDAYPLIWFFLCAGTAFGILGVRSSPWRHEAGSGSTSPAVEACSVFWKKARNRRNLCFATWFGWIVAAPILIRIYSLILSTTNQSASMGLAVGTWMVVFWWAQIRLSRLRCFRCGKQAFSHPLFFMKDAKCRSCGITPAGEK